MLGKKKPDFKNVRMLAMDFDGIHTDGFVYVDQNGNETVRCSRKDGLGFEEMKKAGIKLYVISKEENPAVTVRCNKLGIECYQGVTDGTGKKEILETLIEREGVAISEVLFIGDDINDLEAIEYAGIGVTVADGHPKVKEVADHILERRGGEHALRELAEYILASKR